MTGTSADVQDEQVPDSLADSTLFDQTRPPQHEQHLRMLPEIPPSPPPLCQKGHNHKSRKSIMVSKLTLADKVEIIRLRDSPHASSTIPQLARDFKVPFHRHATFCI